MKEIPTSINQSKLTQKERIEKDNFPLDQFSEEDQRIINRFRSEVFEMLDKDVLTEKTWIKYLDEHPENNVVFKKL